MRNEMADTIVFSDVDGGRTMKFTFAPETRPLEGYTIKRAIQRGGFGEVYYALSDGGKEVALKLIQQNMDIELRGVSQCLNLKHPNLVTIFDIRQDADGDHWVIMEYVSGRSLDRVLRDHPRGMPIEEVQKWLAGIAAGIGFLHDRGIVHRDLKPANIYSEGATVKVGDVGLSKFISPSRRSAHTQSVGTVYYMAPEVAHGRYGREVDVYSLAVILYEMLTGRVPFDGETTGEILMKHLASKPDLSVIPERLRPVFARALEKDPQQRTATVEQLEQEFRNAVLGVEAPIEIPADAFVSPPPGARADRYGTAPQYAYTAQQTAPSPNGAPHLHDGGCRQGNRHTSPKPKHWARTAGEWVRIAAPVVIVLAIFAPAMLVQMARIAFATGIFGALGYGTYRIVTMAVGGISTALFGCRKSERAPVRHASVPVYSPPPRQTETRPVMHRQHIPPAAKTVERPQPRYRLRHPVLKPNTRRAISARRRLTELTGSMVLAVLCTAVLSAGLALTTDIFPNDGAIGLFALTSLLGSWGILAVSKLWEGRGETPVRRFVFLGLGVAVGAAAYWTNQALMVDFPQYHHDAHNTFRTLRIFGPHPLRDLATQPTFGTYVLFFGTLFSLRRWWWHADSFRAKRLRIGTLMLTTVVAGLASTVWAFPMLWAMTWAAAISSVVQVSSVWVPPEERQKLVEGRADA